MGRKTIKLWYDCEFIENGHTIDLISIGMVDEAGRELYLISSEFDEKKASQWVKDNVLIHIPPADEVKRHSKAKIRRKIINFLGGKAPEWWAYYCSYDHVVLCQLFGAMVDLPANWPHYTKDIKQYADFLNVKSLPKQGKGTHNALSDAKWNKQAYDYLVQIDKLQNASGSKGKALSQRSTAKTKKADNSDTI